MKKYIIIDLLNVLYTDENNSRVIPTEEEIDWANQAEKEIIHLKETDSNIRMILSKMNSKAKFGHFQMRAYTILKTNQSFDKSNEFIYVVKCRSRKRNECFMWYLFFFYVLAHSNLANQNQVSFVIGNNDESPCNLSKRIYCSSETSKIECDHAACGLDDYLIILLYSFLLKTNSIENIVVVSKDQYRDFDEIVNFFSQNQKEFMKSVRFITRCNQLPYIDYIETLTLSDLHKPNTIPLSSLSSLVE